MAEDKPAIDPEVSAAFEEGKPVFYSNNININTSLNDMRLSFGKSNPYGPNIYDVHVYISLPTAKQLLGVLVNHVSHYEEQFGVVQPIPKDDTK